MAAIPRHPGQDVEQPPWGAVVVAGAEEVAAGADDRTGRLPAENR
ncbi:MAG: hypothetical protein QOG89_3573, partial [Thermomicrobiales bacterium]|nr:hypothetical protein [Thermomicrobiales bacterium]